MRVKVLVALASAAAVSALFIAATAAPASAHVLKTVGPYHLLIGFGSEPTYAGEQNSVFLQLTNARTGAAIVDEGLGDTLKVEVGFGTQTKLLPLVSSFDPDSGQGTRGVYNAYFIPAVRGDPRRRQQGGLGFHGTRGRDRRARRRRSGAVRWRDRPRPMVALPVCAGRQPALGQRGMRSLRAVLLVAVLALAGVGVLASPASAHALLERSYPAAGASLPRAPHTMLLYFTEAPEPTLSTVSLLDSSSQTVPGVGKPAVVPGNARELRATLPSLTDGVYTVNWRTVSKVDGHVTGGSFAFGIGVLPPAGASAAQAAKSGSLSTGS